MRISSNQCMTETEDTRTPREFLIALVLLWLSGAGLRITVLAVPPVIPLIHQDLHLTQAGVGFLTALPSLLFAAAAVPGSLLISRFGPVRTLVAGLLLTAVASALRGAASNAALLYGTTFLMGGGISIMQPALPRVVRDWLPHRIGFGTAVYSNGLLMGELLAVWLTGPIVLPLLGGNWRLSLVLWALPVLFTAGLVAALVPRPAAFTPAGSAIPLAWWPDWKSPLIWRLGFILGCVNSLYFGTNFFLPDYLHHTQRAGLIDKCLTALNLCQLPASLLLLALAGRLTRRKESYIILAMALLLSLIGLVFLPGEWVVVSSGLFGFTISSLLILILALPPLLSAPHDVHRVSAGMFTISYSCAVVIPILSGFLWDLTRVPMSVFLPIGLCPLALMALASGLRLGKP
jgi:CP family cyanate transporter-like MFS transporter